MKPRSIYGVLDTNSDITAQRAPVTWLASYPRSGNTLLRVILSCCFNQFTQSIYEDNEFADPIVKRWVGHQAVGNDPVAFVEEAKRNNRTLYVKTHEAPRSDWHPTIYVVRDGRSAVVSHTHFLREILGIDAEIRDVIAGKFGLAWGDHVKAWTCRPRSSMLVVRFEDLTVADPATLRAISSFIGRDLVREFDVSFDALHSRSPLFFRRGSNEANIAELSSADLELFDTLHGGTLREMGYKDAS